MANKNFKVRNGLDIGDSVTITDAGAATGLSTVNTTTLDATNVEVTNIKAKDGTAAITVADSTGVVTVSSALNVDNINVSGNTVSSTDTNGNVILAPNGSGDLVLTFANGGNLVNSRNYVFGAIRNATTESIGDIWAQNVTGTSGPIRGLSIDNSLDTTRQSGFLARSYGDSAGNRSRLVFERSRGTAASPSSILAGDFLGEIDATGYSTTGWINDTRNFVPGYFGFNAVENWVSNTNLGTSLSISLAPSATTITAGTNLTQCLNINPQGTAIRSDLFCFTRGKTTSFLATNCSTSGTTLTIGTLISGSIGVGAGVNISTTAALNGMYIVRNISGSGSGSTWELSGSPGTLSGLAVLGSTGYLGGAGGTTVDALADLRLLRNAIKGSGGTTQIVTSSAGATLELRGDNIQLENAAGTSIVGNNITYNRVYAQWEQDGPVIPAAANTSYVFAIGTAVDSNIASVVSTSRITPGAAGKYNLQFSLQWLNGANAEHKFYVWLRKNGVNVANSTGDVTCAKSASGVSGWNYIVSSANATDYFELAYQVASTDITFPYVATFGTAPNDVPAAPALITTLTPVGA